MKGIGVFWSGRYTPLLGHTPLRSVREFLNSYGSTKTLSVRTTHSNRLRGLLVLGTIIMAQSEIAKRTRTTCCQWNQMVNSGIILRVIYQLVAYCTQSLLNSPEFESISHKEYLLFPFPKLLDSFPIFKSENLDIGRKSKDNPFSSVVMS